MWAGSTYIPVCVELCCVYIPAHAVRGVAILWEQGGVGSIVQQQGSSFFVFCLGLIQHINAVYFVVTNKWTAEPVCEGVSADYAQGTTMALCAQHGNCFLQIITDVGNTQYYHHHWTAQSTRIL
jgi:hypothetical protein